jgi:hypothetical protein
MSSLPSIDGRKFTKALRKAGFETVRKKEAIIFCAIRTDEQLSFLFTEKKASESACFIKS